MRVAGTLALFSVALAVAPAPASAQLRPINTAQTNRRGAYDIRDRIKANWAKKRQKKNAAPEPTVSTNANAVGMHIPQGETPVIPDSLKPKVAPVFQPPGRGDDPPPSTGDPGSAPPDRTRPPPRPRPPIVPGLRAPSVRSVETPEDLEEYEAVQRVRKAASVRIAVSRAARADEKLTEVGLVQRVMGALDMPAPSGAEDLRRTGLQVRPSSLEAGDLLFFQIPHGGKITDHVAVFFGENRFAYVGPRGVSLAPLDDTWRRRLLMVRRPR